MARKIVRGQGSPKGKKVANKTGGKKAAAEKLIKELQQQGEDDNAPEGLDELINSIKKEVDDKEKKEKEDKKKMSALVKVITEGGEKKDEKVEQEDIDERVLELLGIENYEAELDYEQYTTLLKEYLVQQDMGGGKEKKEGDTEVLKQALKSARGKKGKFKTKTAKKRTVTASGFKGEKKDTPGQEAQVVDKGSLIPKDEQKGPDELKDEGLSEEKIDEIKAEIDEKVKEQLVPLSKTLSEIEKNLEKILETDKKKLDLEKQAARDADKKEETEGFQKTEAKLEDKEKGAKVKSAAVDKLKPVSNIFDMIGNFFTNVLMGGAIQGLLNFIEDPGKAFKGLTDFLNSTLIPFINDVIKFFNDIVFLPINLIIDGINDGFNELEYALKEIQKVIPIPDIKFPDIPNLKIPDVPNIPDGFGWFQKQESGGEVINLNIPNRSIQRQSTGGGVMNVTLPEGFGGLQQQATGGSVVNANNLSVFDGGAIDGKSGLTITGMGKDTQLIAAQPGEVMMSKKAVDAYGAENLLAANAMAGGNNTPKFGKIAGFQEGGQVGRVIIGAGHAPTVENAARGIMLGSDGRSVQGTADDGSSGRNTPGNATGVREWEATKHVVDTLKRLVEERGLSDKIGFKDIYSWKGLKGVPREVESVQGQQFVDLHFDARGFGRAGVLPSANESATDRSLMSIFGRHSENFKPSSKGVTAGGGTLLELSAIDDPAIRSLLQEVKKGEQGPASMEMAEKILRGILPSIQGASIQSEVPQVELDPNDLSGAPPPPILPPPPGAQLGKTKVEVTQIPPPVIQSGGGTSVLPVPTGGQSQTSAASAAQGRVPGFSAEDGSNFDLIVVKSIYNIVG